jgi:molybdenum cofactor biosynthesis enzyme MoaA
MKSPLIVVSDSKGNIFEIPDLLMVGASVNSIILPDETSIIQLPQSSVLFTLPKRIPIGYDCISKKPVAHDNYRGEPIYAVAAFLPPGYIRTLSSAYHELSEAPRLPLYCYSAVGWKNGRFYVAGNRIDRQMRHEIADESFEIIDKHARIMLKRFPQNRLIKHLVENCVLKYRCPNACNLVLGKWECPIPVSSACNASCLGCISHQKKESGFCSSQHRLDFTPTVKEIEEYVVPHLQKAPNPIVSFGQGCEGEPLLKVNLIEESIKRIRGQTSRGILNINTNASLPKAVERICRAGINSMRVSLNSAQEKYYTAYYQPKNYCFKDVCESIAIADRYNVWVSLNYLAFPGFTDHPSEMAALKKMLNKNKINMIQTRNLNIDPHWFIEKMGLNDLKGKAMGMNRWIHEIKKDFPNVRLGYFNPTPAQIKVS